MRIRKLIKKYVKHAANEIERDAALEEVTSAIRGAGGEDALITWETGCHGPWLANEIDSNTFIELSAAMFRKDGERADLPENIDPAS